MQQAKLVKPSQCDAILAHLKEGNTITQIDALNKFGCFRLGSRINDLRNRGHNIECQTVKTKTGKRIGQYRLNLPESKA